MRFFYEGDASFALFDEPHGLSHAFGEGLTEEPLHGFAADEPDAAGFPAVAFVHAGGGVAGAARRASDDAAVAVPDVGGFDRGEDEEKGINGIGWHFLSFVDAKSGISCEEPCVSGAACLREGKDGTFTGVFTVPLDALGIDMVELRRFLRGQDLFERIKGEREWLHLSEVSLIELGREDSDAILSCRQRSPGREATAGKKGTVDGDALHLGRDAGADPADRPEGDGDAAPFGERRKRSHQKEMGA